jgi:two-component system response regulator
MYATNAVDILLVEDNPEDAELTTTALKTSNITNRIFVVEDGAEAVDFLFCQGKYAERSASHSPKVVLLDLKLPKMSGLEVLRTLKRDDRTRSIPVVIVTSSREDPDIKEAYALGANSYIVKPIGFESFADSVNKLGLYWLLLNQPPK